MLTPSSPTTPKLPLLEEALAMEIARYHFHGFSELEWRASYQRLAKMPPSASLSNIEAANRLEQAILNLKTAGLWPW